MSAVLVASACGTGDPHRVAGPVIVHDLAEVLLVLNVLAVDGDAAGSSLIVKVVDDVPTAHADTNSVGEGGSVNGNGASEPAAEEVRTDG